jgi:CheY-like chemotaxis protein
MLSTDPSMIRVLVVDDQAAMRSIIKRLLNQSGICNVDQAPNGEEALKRLRNPRIKDPDVIISDLHMDGIDGIELCNTIRRDERIRERAIPVLILTGDEDDLIHEVSQQVGAVRIMTKPISADELFSNIQDAIGISLGV